MPTIERGREPRVYSGNRGRFATLVEVRQHGVARPARAAPGSLQPQPDRVRVGLSRLGSGAIGAGDPRRSPRATTRRRCACISSSNGRLRPSSIGPAGGCRRARSTVGLRNAGNETCCAAGKRSRPAKTRRGPRRARTVRRKGIGAGGRPGGEPATRCRPFRDRGRSRATDA